MASGSGRMLENRKIERFLRQAKVHVPMEYEESTSVFGKALGA